MAADTGATKTSKELPLQTSEVEKYRLNETENNSRKSISPNFAKPFSKTVSFEPRIPALIPLGALSSSSSSSSNSKRAKGPKQPSQAPISLPQARIRTIMKSAPNVSFLSQDTVALTVKVAELFVRKLATISHETMSKHSSASSNIHVNYSDLVNAVQSSTALGFLRDFLPHKVTIKEFQQKNDHSRVNDGSLSMTIPSSPTPAILPSNESSISTHPSFSSNSSTGTHPPFSSTSLTGTPSSNTTSTGTVSIPHFCNSTASVPPPPRNIVTTNEFMQPHNTSRSNI